MQGCNGNLDSKDREQESEGIQTAGLGLAALWSRCIFFPDAAHRPRRSFDHGRFFDLA